MPHCPHAIITNVDTKDEKHVCEECGTVLLIYPESDGTILRMDRITAAVISRALKVFHDDLWTGDPAGRMLRGQASYIREFIEDTIEDADRTFIDSGLVKLLKKIAVAHTYDPGETDLDDEQPVSVSLDLGDIRNARSMING